MNAFSPIAFDPVFQFLHAAFQFISDLVHPKSLNIPPKLNKPLIAKLVPHTQLTGPASMIALAIDLYCEPAVSFKEGKVKVVLLNTILRNWLQSCRHHRT